MCHHLVAITMNSSCDCEPSEIVRHNTGVVEIVCYRCEKNSFIHPYTDAIVIIDELSMRWLMELRNFLTRERVNKGR